MGFYKEQQINQLNEECYFNDGEIIGKPVEWEDTGVEFDEEALSELLNI